MSYQPPQGPLPGMPGWRPSQVPQHVPPGTVPCMACGLVASAVYANGRRWCARCSSDLGPAPPIPSSTTSTPVLLLTLGLAFACLVGVSLAFGSKPSDQPAAQPQLAVQPTIPPPAPVVPAGPPSYAARNGHGGPRSSCRAFTANRLSPASQSERDFTAGQISRFMRRERRWRRASASGSGTRLTLSNMPSCAADELHALLDSTDENAPTHSSVMCSGEGWETIDCTDVAGARRTIDLEWSCDCQREVFRPNGGSFRCECEL